MNNPINRNDPTGHESGCDEGYAGTCASLGLALGNHGSDGGGGASGEAGDTGGDSSGPSDPAEEAVWQWSRHESYGFHLGPYQAANVPDYYSDYLNDPNVCSAGGFASAACLAALVIRFPFTHGPVSKEANFWVDMDVSYNESVGVTISNVTMYSKYNGYAEIARLKYESGPQVIVPQASSGRYAIPYDTFGCCSLTAPGKPFLGDDPITLTLVASYKADLGDGPRWWLQEFAISLPSLPDLKYFAQTGQIPAPFPNIP